MPWLRSTLAIRLAEMLALVLRTRSMGVADNLLEFKPHIMRYFTPVFASFELRYDAVKPLARGFSQ